MELGQLYRSSAVLGVSDQLPPAQRPDQWAGQPGTRAPHLALRTADGQTASTLDLFQRRWVLLSQNDAWTNAATAAAATPRHLGEPSFTSTPCVCWDR